MRWKKRKQALIDMAFALFFVLFVIGLFYYLLFVVGVW